MPIDAQSLWLLLVASLGGAAIGMERQWSGHATGPAAHFAGIRTFTLLGLLAGLAGLFWSSGLETAATALLAGAVGIILIAYRAASRVDVDGTTEVAALLVLAAGTLAGLGNGPVASGIFAATALLLVEKSRLHTWIQKLPGPGLTAAARFAVMALVVLPLLPEGPFGPGAGIRPRELWLLVLFFSSLSFAGYIARSLAGPGRGDVLTGLLGGLVSSTNVTWTFSRLSRRDPANATPPPAAHSAPDNPLQLSAALQMALLFQAVLYVVHAARLWGGTAGLVTSGALLGLTDVDALTLSMARASDHPSAPLALLAGVLSNSLLKLTVAATLGSGPFRKYASAGLGLLALASALFLLKHP